MKRVIIICEGPTEKEFGQHLLFDHFIQKEILIQCPLIKKTGGGIVHWHTLKKEIETHLLESDVYVTLLIDYYGLHSKHDFPGWENSLKIVNKNERMNFIELSMKNDISESSQHRFIPYMQLHEFEGLLFTDKQIFYNQVDKDDLVGIEELEQTFRDYSDNPEMINNTKETSPSHRLKRIIRGYKKVLYGHYFAEVIGLEKIRNKCPRFNAWLTIIETI